MESNGARRGIVATTLAGLLAACAQSPATSPSPSTGATPAMPAGETSTEARELAVGGFLDLALPANASTGYGWELIETGAPVLRRVDPSPVAEAAPASPPMPGAGGVSRWRFVAERAGTAQLRLVYRRSWEKEVPPAREARYRVTVTAAVDGADGD
ncbi:protease inhibitor I42 family protein [Pseudoxanthomonas sp. 22568]|uniref:protease inhibitor I42 family protein n=1 Tax=Pseudoxanthomonas sp. 22568 TaxID=3453945 RepID=UPI003F857A22